MKTGDRFGLLTVTGEKSGPRVKCACDCGVEKDFLVGNLRRGLSKSCGCDRGRGSRARTGVPMSHGATINGIRSREYKTWCGIIERCTNSKARIFANYGGRGVTMCEAWRHDFPAFLAHIGPIPSPRHSIDRIDNTRGYEPGNVRWATRKVQGQNQRSRPRITAFGLSLTPSEWADRTGLPLNAINMRRRAGWPAERILTRPLRATAPVQRRAS